MRNLLKTSYQQDIRLFPFGGEKRLALALALYAGLLAVAAPVFASPFGPALIIAAGLVIGIFLLRRDKKQEGGGAAFWYGLLGWLLLSAPFFAGEYTLSQMTFVFVYAIAGAGLILLSGYAGQISLGHAAFMACGAYTAAIIGNAGWGLLAALPAAVALSGILGIIIGLPALRMRGIYLAFATYSFAFIVEEVLARWESVTNGNLGLLLTSPAVILPGLHFGLSGETRFYYLALTLCAGCFLVALNISRSATGRAFVAVRDSETAARSLGINTARVKTTAFAVSAAMTGLAGALYGYLIYTITPESFTIVLSINLLMMIVVGGLGSLHGAVFGAIFLVMLPQLIAGLRDTLPSGIASQPGLEAALFGLIIIFFVLFEPMGLYGRWVKIRAYGNMFPLYRKGSFRRQRQYMASERNQ